MAGCGVRQLSSPRVAQLDHFNDQMLSKISGTTFMANMTPLTHALVCTREFFQNAQESCQVKFIFFCIFGVPHAKERPDRVIRRSPLIHRPNSDIFQSI
jgi:hypothetical protein